MRAHTKLTIGVIVFTFIGLAGARLVLLSSAYQRTFGFVPMALADDSGCEGGSADGACDVGAGENSDNCTDDCPVTCGDDYCDSAADETTANCPQDCGSSCGDSAINGNEQCDDGNSTGGDGCSATCQIEPGWTCTGTGPGSCTTTCGDGIVAGAETCDDGNLTNGDGCDSSCNLEIGYTWNGSAAVTTCGDGIKAGAEQCDDGNTTPGDGCDSSCHLEAGYTWNGSAAVATCGDGIVAGTETCDDGVDNGTPNHCNSSCTGTTTPICGNGSIESGEECDDGSICLGPGNPDYSDPIPGSATYAACLEAGGSPTLQNGDGCSDSCTVESGWTCSGSPSVCHTTCGDGVTAGAEECDDHNLTNGDGCNSTCHLEAGYTWNGSAAVTTCGDGIKAGAEQCDDGGTVKLQAHHLSRLAIVYVRQSTPQQVQDHKESAARQYALVDLAVEMGWPADRIQVIDEDQAHSGATAQGRHGFHRLLAEVGLDHVGIILGIELSRLRRTKSAVFAPPTAG